MTTDPFTDLRDEVAAACRILARTGVAREITGHVSTRVTDERDEILVRCRTEDEAGLQGTTIDSIRRIGLETGVLLEPEGAEVPLELPIHLAVLRARPDVTSVVHAHPRYAVLCGLAGVPLRPIYGAYDHHATLLVGDGVPTFDNSLLVRDESSAQALVAALGTHDACLMRGHGVTVVGSTVAQATLRAVRLEHLAEMTWELYGAGYRGQLPDDELRAFMPAREQPVLPRGERWAWNYYRALVD